MRTIRQRIPMLGSHRMIDHHSILLQYETLEQYNHFQNLYFQHVLTKSDDDKN